MTAARLTMSGVTKSFGATRALAGVDLELRPGEVHALVGENGAGKSTLMKVLSGALAPDSGVMAIDGHHYAPSSPRFARRQGVAMVYQELTLCPDLSVEANILLGLESSSFGFLRGGHNRLRVREVLTTLEHPEIHPDASVADLGPAARQLVEIARGLISDVRVLVLDEPTSALTQSDADRLFALIRRLREQDVTIVYISHFLEEVEAIADRVTVLRDGRNVATGRVGDFSRDRMIELMVGRSLTEQYPRIAHDIGEPVLELAHLSGERSPIDVSLTLRRGEILGLAGLIGAGRTELLRSIYALDPVRRGEIKVRTVASPSRSPAQRIEQGLGLLSEDRKTEGLALDQSVLDNLTYSRLAAFTTLGWLREQERRASVRDWLRKLNVRYSNVDQTVSDLSGGNQQKVAFGRLLHQQADVLMLDEPTKGVDVGSKAEIYRLIGELARSGAAVLFVSSYLPELLGVCDRVAVMCRGRLVDTRPAEQWTPELVMALATGSS